MQRRGLSGIVTTVLIIFVGIIAVAGFSYFITQEVNTSREIVKGGVACTANNIAVVSCQQYVGVANYTIVTLKRFSEESTTITNPLHYAITYTSREAEQITGNSPLPARNGETSSQDFTGFVLTLHDVAVSSLITLPDGAVHECSTPAVTCTLITSTLHADSLDGDASSRSSYTPSADTIDVSGSLGGGGSGYCSIKGYSSCESAFSSVLACGSMNGCAWNVESTLCAGKDEQDRFIDSLIPSDTCDIQGDETTCTRQDGCSWRAGTCVGTGTVASCSSTIDRTCTLYAGDETTCTGLGCSFTPAEPLSCQGSPTSCSTWNSNADVCGNQAGCMVETTFDSCEGDALSCEQLTDNPYQCAQQQGCEVIQDGDCSEFNNDNNACSARGCDYTTEDTTNCGDHNGNRPVCEESLGCSWNEADDFTCNEGTLGICSGNYEHTCQDNPGAASCDTFGDEYSCNAQDGCSANVPFTGCSDGASSCDQISTAHCGSRDGCGLSPANLASCSGSTNVCPSISPLETDPDTCASFACQFVSAGATCNPREDVDSCGQTPGCEFRSYEGGFCSGGLPVSCYSVPSAGYSCDSFSAFCQLQSMPASCGGELDCSAYQGVTSCTAHSFGQNGCEWIATPHA